MAINGVASMASPTAAGSVSSNVSRNPQSSNAENSSAFCVACCFTNDGSNTVPSATPSSADGNSIKRSAAVSQDTEPVSRNEAIWVLIKIEICATETPNSAGAIKPKIRSTPLSFGCQSHLGSMPMRFSAGT